MKIFPSIESQVVTNALRAAALAAAVLAAVLAYASGLLNQDNLRALFTDSGAVGPVLFVALFSVVQPFGFPGIIFMLLSVVIWPLWFAFLLNLAGASGAGVVGFGFARFVGRDWVQRRLPKRLRDLEERVLTHAFLTVLVVRLTTYLLPPASWALGLSPVRFGPFLLATVIGLFPMTAFITFAGANALTWLGDQPREVWIGLGTVVIVLALVLGLARRRRSAGSAQHKPDTTSERGSSLWTDPE